MITSKQLERAVGIDTAFKMMRLWERAVQGASGNQFTTRKMPSKKSLFKALCLHNGITEWQANMYMELDPNE